MDISHGCLHIKEDQMTKLICVLKNGSLEIGTMEEIIERVRKKIIASLEKEDFKTKEKEYGKISIVYSDFDEYIHWDMIESISLLKDTPILSRADIYPHLKKLEKEVTLYRKIKSRKSSLADILDAEEELKDILYQPDYNIDAEYNKSRPAYKIFKFEYDNTDELRLAFKYYGDIRADIAYSNGYDDGCDA